MSRFGAIASGSGIALVASYLGVTSARDGDALQSFLTLIFGGVLALVCFGLMPQPPARAPFRLINHLVMTRAEQAPTDSWVHVASTRPYRRPFVAATVVAALGCIGMSVFAGLQAFGAIPRVSPDTSDGGLFLGMIALALLGIATGALASLLVWRSVRNGSVGSRPSGIALGAETVSVRVPGRDVQIPWDRIVSVRAQISPLGRREHVAVILLRLQPESGSQDRVQVIPAEGYTVATSALYTALRWYLAHPESRWELGRVEGQQRLDRWCADSAACATAPNVR